MDLDVNNIGDFLRKERSSPSLQPVEDDFYQELRGLLSSLDDKYPPFSREKENLKNLVTDIFNYREKKLLLTALSYARSGEREDLQNATPDEEQFFHKLVEMLKKRRDEVMGGAGSVASDRPDTNVPKEKKASGQQKKAGDGAQGLVTLRILEELPPVVGPDGRTYGPFRPEDVVALPEGNAKVFIKHCYGEPINI